MSDESNRVLECRDALASILLRRLQEGDTIPHQWAALNMLFVEVSRQLNGGATSADSIRRAILKAVDPATPKEDV